jgi:HSP20 family protein
MAIRNLLPALSRKHTPARRETPIDSLHREVNDLFDGFFRSFERDLPAATLGGKAFEFQPSLDVTEDEKSITVTAEVPGVDEGDVEVSLARDSLTIRGEKREEKVEKGRDYHRTERVYGSFARTVALPGAVDTDKAEASFRKGVLTVRIPKVEAGQPLKKKIPVRAG